MSPKRKKVEEYIIKHLMMIDPGGTNAERYKAFFAALDDKAFHDYMLSIRKGETQIYIYVPNLKINLKMEDLFKAADSLKLELFERIQFKDPVTGKSYLTPEKYLVLKLPVRRVSQILSHKRSIPDSDKRIDLLSGQVVKPDKAASLSRIEMQFLLSKGLEHTTQELAKYRGGDIAAYAGLKRELEENGQAHVTLNETGSVSRSAMVYQTLLAGMHIKANVVTEG